MITSKQWFQIISGSVSGLITGAAFFQTLFGQTITLDIIAGLGLINIMVSSVGTVLSGPDSPGTQIRAVAAMPGVERIDLNAKATDGVAAAGADPTLPKVGGATPAIQAALVAKAGS